MWTGDDVLPIRQLVFHGLGVSLYVCVCVKERLIAVFYWAVEDVGLTGRDETFLSWTLSSRNLISP